MRIFFYFSLFLFLFLSLSCTKATPHKRSGKAFGEAYKPYSKGDFKTTASNFEEYLKQYPEDELAWNVLGNCYERLGMDQKSEEAYLKAISLHPKFAQAYTGLGILSRKKKKYDEALNHYKKALEFDPKYAHSYSSMAVIYLKLNKDKEALASARRGYELDSKDPVIAANLAVVYHYNKMVKERDLMAETAKKLGYRNMKKMEEIFQGKITVRD